MTGERQWEHCSNDKENILKFIISTVFIISIIDIKTSIYVDLSLVGPTEVEGFNDIAVVRFSFALIFKV